MISQQLVQYDFGKARPEGLFTRTGSYPLTLDNSALGVRHCRPRDKSLNTLILPETMSNQ